MTMEDINNQFFPEGRHVEITEGDKSEEKFEF